MIVGRGGYIGPPGILADPSPHPPTHIRKSFLRNKLKFTKGARIWRLILGTQTFFCPPPPPPPPPPV